MNFMLLVNIIIPILGGALIPVLPLKTRKSMMLYVEGLTLLTSVLVFTAIFNIKDSTLTLLNISGRFTLAFMIDDLGSIFSGMIAFLWPLAVLYSFEYMKHEERERNFFAFYIMTYGVTLGISWSASILTLYAFFELLTLSTMPLVMHTMTREAIHASRTYLYYSLGGAAFALAGVVFVLAYSTVPYFTPGGSLDMEAAAGVIPTMYLVYIMSFLGFGVKTAIFPLCRWLPKAGVAPTPVTALLHAVAVVKAGAFAAMRVTYYAFGADNLRGSWAQTVVMALAVFTIVYGCARALKETHLKRRLAWSTVGNLAYIMFGVTIMTPLGLAGALSHMLFHAVMKICSFFCAGSIIYVTGKQYINELNGLGKRMPRIFFMLAVSSFGLMGVPGLCGFISKWEIVKACVADPTPLSIAGVVALLMSALLTTVYMMTIAIRAYFPGKGFDYTQVQKYKDPGWMMLLPLAIFTVIIIYFGVNSGWLIHTLETITAGL